MFAGFPIPVPDLIPLAGTKVVGFVAAELVGEASYD